MQYLWITTDDQDNCIHKLCPLGPYMLELIEDKWLGSHEEAKLQVAFYVYMWDYEGNCWEKLKTDLKPQEYNRKHSHKVLEDWYACNVLIESYFGEADG